MDQFEEMRRTRNYYRGAVQVDSETGEEMPHTTGRASIDNHRQYLLSKSIARRGSNESIEPPAKRFKLSSASNLNQDDNFLQGYGMHKRELIKVRLGKLLSGYSEGKAVEVKSKLRITWSDCSIQNNILKLKFDKNENEFKVHLKLRTLEIMKKIHCLVQSNSTCTESEVYDHLKKYTKRPNFFSSMCFISNLVEVEPWYFPINSPSKGLLFGSLTMKYSNDHIISINKNTKETRIPQDIIQIKKFTSNASFIVVVQTYAIFQKLIEEDIANKLATPFILIADTGRPDINTRLFTKQMVLSLKIPVYTLVDLDLYGIDFILMYKFGSLKTARWNDHLAIPSLKWLGILPSEIPALTISHNALNQVDKSKLLAILKRPYIIENPCIKKELDIMLQHNIKVKLLALDFCLIDKYNLLL